MTRGHWTVERPARRWPPAPLEAREHTICPRCLGTGYVARPGYAGMEKYRGEAAQIPCPECHSAGRILRPM